MARSNASCGVEIARLLRHHLELSCHGNIQLLFHLEQVDESPEQSAGDGQDIREIMFRTIDIQTLMCPRFAIVTLTPVKA